ncbi:MAG: flippase, partial [Thiogranum sp.]
MARRVLDFIDRHELMRYLGNTSWMFAEQALKLVSGVFVGIYVARYLGPERFGVYSYALAIVSVFMAVSKIGMESVLVRELVRHPDRRQEYMGTAFGLMVGASLVSILVIGSLVSMIEDDHATKVYVLIMSAGLIFQASLVVDYLFQSEVKARLSSIAKSLALSVNSIVKIALVLAGADLLAFAIVFVIEQLMVAVFLVFMYFREGRPSFFSSFRYSIIARLLKSAWPMVMSGVAGMLLMRVDQVMIKHFLGAYQLGIYGAAAKIYEAWIVLPFILSISILPLITQLKSGAREEYEKKLVWLFVIVFWTSILFAIVISLTGERLVLLAFGEGFDGAGAVLTILIWASALSAFGFMSARYLVVEGMERKIARRNWIAIMINIPLNLFMIPAYGIEGAAMATLISLLIVHYLIDILDRDLHTL